MITIIDYGLGNIQAFLNIYKELHVPAQVARNKDDLEGASKLILPGVGHFDYAMQKFNTSGMREEIERLVLKNKVTTLGICVGMQMMADFSEEGVETGLGWIKGTIKNLKAILKNKDEHNLPLPHMGWNKVTSNHKRLFNNLNSNDLEFYFLHSYYFDCTSKKNYIANTRYGSNFCCAVNSENIFGVQFHPEKSHHFGVQLLKNFSEL
jgi:glutamine amidotransferase